MGGYAWVTLATNNSYSLGALVLAHSLKKANTAHKLAVLITPAVSDPMREQLQTVFDLVKVVDVLDSKDEAHLALMKRPDLGITFTKIHCWRLVEFEKCVFLDADTLVVRNCDELFEREEFSAAPDVSWPDCFNSGVFVYRPSVETFNKLLQFAVENRSFDGGDQGLLNQFFSDWATEDIKKHLPFVYNLTSIAAYSYIPAFKHYGSETRIVHFIGTGKPWLQQLDAGTRTVTPTSGSEHLAPLLQQWWDLFCEKVHPNLDKNLESNNDGMPHPPVEACSNSLAIALTDEPQTTRLTEPCTPYREKDDFRQYNLPYQPFDVKGSSGELLNVEFLLSSVPPEEESTAESSHDQPRREDDRTEEVIQVSYNAEETKRRDEETECRNQPNEERHVEEVVNKPEEAEEEEKVEEGQQNQQEEPPPPKDPFDYNSFFPDETCVSNYLEQNVATYQPYENHQNHHQQKDAGSERQSEQEPPSLPRFLTIPENDRRQSGNVEANTREECEPPKSEPPKDHEVPERIEPPPKEPTPPREEPLEEKRELPKSKSMSHLPSDAPATETEPPPRRSIWKSQPNVNVDPNRRYSMPKLKPILPKQNSFSKSVPSAMPKVTLYTEFLMSAEYKDPVDLPKDKVGFVESHIHKEAKLRRCKSDADIRSKFGPLPYALSPEVEKPVIPKKFPPRHLDNELYDLAQCKRQMGNKPKPKDNDGRKENVRPLPALRPIAPAKDKKSTLIKKRKSKELSPGDGGREKMLRREPKIARERKREPKLTPRNVSTNGNGNNLDEILQRLREFSKNYQHFFGVEPKRQTVKCKNAAVQVSEGDGVEYTASEAYETVRTAASTKSRETQTGREASVTEFRQFRNYVKDKRETSQKGLLGIQDIMSETLSGQAGTESEGDSKPDNQTVTTDSSSLQEVADTTPVHPTDSNSRFEVGTPSVEKEAGNLDSNVSSSLENCNSSEQSLTPAEAQIRESETNIPDLEDHNINEQGLNCAEVQPTGLEVQIENIEDRKRTEESAAEIESVEVQKPILEDNTSTEGVRPAEVESKESKTNIPISEDSDSRATEKHSAESEMPTPEQSNTAGQMAVEVQSKEIETNSPDSHPTSHLELNTDEPTTTATADTMPTEVTKSEDSNRPNASDSPAAIQTPENPNDHPDTFDQNPESLTPKPDENDVKEHSRKNGCDSPPPEEKTSTELKTGVENKNDTTRGSSEHPAVEPPTSPVVSSPVTAHNGHPSPPEDREEPQQKKKEQPANGVDTPKNPHEILCVPDFETPRSSRVPLPGKEHPEEVTTLENGTHPTPDGNGGDSEANGFGDSPVGTGRFVGKKKSGRTSPSSPKPSTPICGNPQTGSSEDLKRGSGIAGAIAQLSLEAGAQTPESAAASAAHQEYLRRQNWETGNMDYMGRDSFDNIWSKICQTLEAKEAEEAAAGSPKEVTTDEKKPEANAPAEEPVSLSTILQKCPEYIETLPGDPAAGPVEDDEIIFSKPDNRQQCLTNITEEKEGRKEGSDAAGNVKLSDILKSGTDATGGGDVKPVPVEKVGEAVDQAKADASKSQEVATPTVGPITQTAEQTAGEKPQPSTTPAEEKAVPPAQAAEDKPQPPVQPTEEKPQTAATPSGEKAEAPVKTAEEKPQPSPTPTGEKPQPSTTPAEEKAVPPAQAIEEKPQSAATAPGEKAEAPAKTAEEKPPAQPTEEKPQPSPTPTGEKAQPVVAPAESKPAEVPQPEKPDCKTSPVPPTPPQTPSAEGQAEPQKKATECTTVAIPSPPIVFPGAPFSDKPGDKSKKSEDKPEVVSEPIPLPPPESPTLASPQEPTAKTSDSVKDEGKQKKGVFTKILEMVGVAPKEKNGSEASKSVFYDVEGGAEEAKEIEQASEVKVKSEGEAEEVKKPEESVKAEELPPSKPEETKSETAAESKAVTAKEETSPPEKQDGETKPGQAPMPKPARSSQEGKKPADSIQVSSARKSPSPKLTIPQKPPETAITTPTPPPQPDVPPRKNSGLLKVDDTILETPPVTEARKEDVVEAVKGKVDDIIGKAKSEVESLLQDRRSAEKEAGESSDLINAMKLMMGADQPEKPEEVEELRVTSEEERKRHKGEVVSSKLSDQILKAIPPPRRKAISEASASTSAIPKATTAPEQKTPPGESKGKPSKPSSIPVPPPRSRGKPTQPSPPKGKGKK